MQGSDSLICIRLMFNFYENNGRKNYGSILGEIFFDTK